MGVKRKENDRVIWVKGDNGVVCTRWISQTRNRMDLKVLSDYYKGDRCPDDESNPNNPAYKAPVLKKATTKSSTTKPASTATEDKE